MAKGFRICKICGKSYEYCHTNRPTDIFRYQDVACCPEHGVEYFKLIAKSRGDSYGEEQTAEKDNSKKKVVEKRTRIVNNVKD